MKAWIYVDGPSDVMGLNTLWSDWRQRLKLKGWGIQVIDLQSKSKFFAHIGPRAAEKLRADPKDLVVGLPDLYPVDIFRTTDFAHSNLLELQNVQRLLVENNLRENEANMLERFFPSAFKHDFEVLLLSAKHRLRDHLQTSDELGKWRQPVEEQNHDHPPKYIVNELYRKYHKRKYRETTDAVAVLRRVEKSEEIFYSDSRQLQCPAFKEMVDWIVEKTGVPAY